MEIAGLFETAYDNNDPSIMPLVLEKLKVLHSDGWVHGDCRPNNVLISKDKRTVWFIDFDYSGKQGVDMYPPCMKMNDITWADGVEFGLPLRREHDLHFWQ
jgi:RIO-like serine/threonine protein kinase